MSLRSTFDSEPGGPYPAGLYNSATTAELLPGLDDIGTAQLERYQRLGYLAVRSAIDESQRQAVLVVCLIFG